MTALFTFRPLAAVGGAVMIAAIALAWGFELLGGFDPCPLCLEQRVPYYVAIPFGLAALGAAFAGATVPARLLAFAAAAAMVWAAGLGIYHAGVEWSFWEGPAACAGGSDAFAGSGTLLDTLAQTQFVSCSAAPGRFLGLSFAGWNVVSASAAALLLAAAAFAPLKR